MNRLLGNFPNTQAGACAARQNAPFISENQVGQSRTFDCLETK